MKRRERGSSGQKSISPKSTERAKENRGREINMENSLKWKQKDKNKKQKTEIENRNRKSESKKKGIESRNRKIESRNRKIESRNRKIEKQKWDAVELSSYPVKNKIFN